MKLDLSKQIDIQRAKTYLDKLIKDGSKVELKKYVKKRTLSQNNYLHTCLTIFSQETGYTLSESKELFAQSLSYMFYEKNGHTFRRSTADLNTHEMTELIELIRETCNTQLGCYIPTSTEYLVDKFAIEKEFNI